ncbi:Rho GTPase activation protein [Rhizoclosmatium globosum]|uniref:Rho GTPase activation protein n=1 Tax=Rhizoclosmatium globosum TaxID=329046 RepID=A0A1Y2C0M2_9FUNG|nr:Rho GTPase activation protein [Rhizoclosmatium globosum]|eukprot:ORY40427.1 Rho GTPase activation protein [Rhizoclosmatium globosum]
MKQLLRRITNIGARSNGALGTSSTVFNLSLDHMLGADQGKAASSLQLSDKHKGSSLSASSTKTNALGSDSDKQVPVILQRFVEYLSSPEALETEGLFRIAAPVKQVKELRESIEKNGLAELSKLDPYDGINIVASLFKQWLRDIPEGVVPKSHFQKLVDCGASPSKLQAVLRTLPKPNLDFLEYLLKYLYKVVSHSSKNLMTVQNLVIVFAPNLFSCPSAPSVVSSGNPEKYLVESMQVTKIMANIMENYEEIFQGPKTKHSNRNSSSSRQSTTLLNEEYEPIIPPFTRIKLNDELDERFDQNAHRQRLIPKTARMIPQK